MMNVDSFDFSTFPPQDFTDLYQALGYTFTNKAYLIIALTHPSFGIGASTTPHNQRFEFLGDAILDYIITNALFSSFPTMQEGTLTRFRSLLVRGENLALLARELKLGDYLFLDKGAKKNGLANKESVLADSFEALIAAIYLDSDLTRCEQTVLPLFKTEMLALSNRYAGGRDPKTQLQEYLQKNKLPLPIYKTTSPRNAPEEKKHIALCSIKGIIKDIKGYGKSRRKAEQAAAALVIKTMKLKDHEAKE